MSDGQGDKSGKFQNWPTSDENSKVLEFNYSGLVMGKYPFCPSDL